MIQQVLSQWDNQGAQPSQAQGQSNKWLRKGKVSSRTRGDQRQYSSFSLPIHSPPSLCTSTELSAVRAVPIPHTPGHFQTKKSPLTPFSQKSVKWALFCFCILWFWSTCPFITSQVFPRKAQPAHGGMIMVAARIADRLHQAAPRLQHLHFDASTLHGCQCAMTDCPSPPCRLHLDAVKVALFFGALVRHQAGALRLCLWEWTCWNFSCKCHN